MNAWIEMNLRGEKTANDIPKSIKIRTSKTRDEFDIEIRPGCWVSPEDCPYVDAPLLGSCRLQLIDQSQHIYHTLNANLTPSGVRRYRQLIAKGYEEGGFTSKWATHATKLVLENRPVRQTA